MKLAHWLSDGVMVSGLVSGSTSANASDITLQLRQRPFGLSSPDRQELFLEANYLRFRDE